MRAWGRKRRTSARARKQASTGLDSTRSRLVTRREREGGFPARSLGWRKQQSRASAWHAFFARWPTNGSCGILLAMPEESDEPVERRAVQPSSRVCPRCGSEASENDYCSTCDLHLAAEPELPTRLEWEQAHGDPKAEATLPVDRAEHSASPHAGSIRSVPPSAESAEPHTRVCPDCGSPAGAQAFCASCGRNLTTVERLPTRAEWELADTSAGPTAAPFGQAGGGSAQAASAPQVPRSEASQPRGDAAPSRVAVTQQHVVTGAGKGGAAKKSGGVGLVVIIILQSCAYGWNRSSPTGTCAGLRLRTFTT